MAIQVTVFPKSGLAICLTLNPLLPMANHFIKFWASLCKERGNLAPLQTSLSLPSHERDTLQDPKKCEAAHIESSGSISLSDCRDENGGIEVGMALDRTQMNKFRNILGKELHNINKF
ncbi:hypothetical protein LR48_Vigan05g153400 [Vigna angularis]|uniref:Uncharacterized protein n=1 Tax=Phaseolus angularis TaxID=3914 RepID=A0A0L9UN06_PHAAN|nr:hypothetical protein LR48_Vigan05g153400 [Vigna angularis]